MKIFALLVASLLVAGVAEARDKSTKRIDEIIFDRTSSAVVDVVEAPSELMQWARDNNCTINTEKNQCIYEFPAKGMVAVAIDTTGDIVQEGALIMTDVPVRILDWMTTQFERCAQSAYTVDQVVCNGLAVAFTWTANGVHMVGNAVVYEVSDLANSAVQSVNLSSDALTYLFGGEFHNAFKNTFSATFLTAGCWVLGKPGTFLFAGKQLNCTEWVANERRRLDGQN